MLKLTNIKKTYLLPNFEVRALDDVSVSFRRNEFVAILGPSGSGKTTLLNIVGGLDQYTSGDLIINERSTKTFKERDWDVYRNHRVGFIFQSYNLIPHQTVLSNVELALTIAGISKEERVQRAKDALDRVGLHDQYNKKPNQLSGGQSQRVAIARALVNDPEILLADEPTGALDTKTSEQIMDLIKEIASDRLVIMVTHNSNLAEKYSNRIINLLDGKIVDDSNPHEIEEIEQEVVEQVELIKTKKEKAKMTWWTTFKLSLQNLFSKSRRTILTAIASSIGIIGISLVLALSFGVKIFISDMQEDMLSGNPITVESNTLDLDKMMDSMGMSEKVEMVKEDGKVNVNKIIEQLAKRASDADSMFVENNITQEYIDYVEGLSDEDVAAILYDFEVDIKPNLYFDFKETIDSEPINLSLTAIINIYTSILKDNEDTKTFANMISNFTNIAKKAPDNEEYILGQYDVLAGRYATEKDEVMLVLSDDRSLTDLLLAQLGYYSQEEFLNVIFKEIGDPDYNPNLPARDYFDYDELMNRTFHWHSNDSIYKEPPLFLQNKARFLYSHLGEEVTPSNDSLELKIVGILEPNENIMYGSLRSGFYYTDELSQYMMEINRDSQIVNTMDDLGISSYTNMPYNNDNDMYAVMYLYEYTFRGETKSNVPGFVGNVSMLSNMLGTMGGSMGGIPMDMPQIYTLTKRDLGGEEIPSKISIYPTDLEHKSNVIKYLNAWNDQEGLADEDRITLTDPLSIIFKMINNMINVITIALIGFTTLALVVSSVMIAIITYVSVVERVKEIGVIRSLGGRKRDVSNLFVAETVIIGFTSGLIAILFTYAASLIINLSVYRHIGFNIAVFPIQYALLMLSISIFLTLISGLIPSRSAAKKDPVVALRSE